MFNKAEPPQSNSSEILELWISLPHFKRSVKIYGRESDNGDFPCAKLENAKKFGDFSLKMSSGMSKEAGSLYGPLCAYLMRQNLHDRTRPRSEGNKCPCQVWKWSVKNYERESVNWACLPCRPPFHPPGRWQYPGALKGCGVIKFKRRKSWI